METQTFLKPLSWTAAITTAELGKPLQFPDGHAKSIRALISGRIKKEYPLLVFSTVVTGGFITVTRVK